MRAIGRLSLLCAIILVATVNVSLGSSAIREAAEEAGARKAQVVDVSPSPALSDAPSASTAGSPTVTASITKSTSITRTITPTISFSASATASPSSMPAGAEQIKLTDSWAYSDATSAPLATWNTLTFDDSAWLRGRTPGGYGYTDILTKYTYGNGTKSSVYAVYLRKQFSVTREPGVLYSGKMTMQVVDGCVVWLNGAEVGRVNMPNASVVAKPTFNTFALNGISGTASYTFYDLFIPDSMVVSGTNLVAVEVHKAGASTKYMRWNAQLLIEAASPSPAPSPSVTPSTSFVESPSPTSSASLSASVTASLSTSPSASFIPPSDSSSPSPSLSDSPSSGASTSPTKSISTSASASTTRTPTRSTSSEPSQSMDPSSSAAVIPEISDAASPAASDEGSVAASPDPVTPDPGATSDSSSDTATISASESSSSTPSPSDSPSFGSLPSDSSTVSVSTSVAPVPSPSAILVISVSRSKSPSPTISKSASVSPSCVCGCSSLSCCANATATQEQCVQAAGSGSSASSSMSTEQRNIVIGVVAGIAGVMFLTMVAMQQRKQKRAAALKSENVELPPPRSQMVNGNNVQKPKAVKAPKSSSVSASASSAKQAQTVTTKGNADQPSQVRSSTSLWSRFKTAVKLSQSSHNMETDGQPDRDLIDGYSHNPQPDRPVVHQQPPKHLRPVPPSQLPPNLRVKVVSQGNKRFLVQQVPVVSPTAPMRGQPPQIPPAMLAQIRKVREEHDGASVDNSSQHRKDKQFKLRLVKIQRRRVPAQSPVMPRAPQGRQMVELL